MSTWFYFECLQHDPRIQSDGEISQHDDHWVEQAVRMAQGITPVPADPWDLSDSFLLNAARFLLQHPRCPIGLVDEYGRRRGIPGRGPDQDRAALERRVVRLDAERSELYDRLEQVQADLDDARQILEIEEAAS